MAVILILTYERAENRVNPRILRHKCPCLFIAEDKPPFFISLFDRDPFPLLLSPQIILSNFNRRRNVSLFFGKGTEEKEANVPLMGISKKSPSLSEDI